ncbi:radical SAM/SPASM domain-containing protein [Sulfurovum sp. AR]|uniref:radical SAM/SPASM domain-containing protein n=1 Tax=Sulfurovum sp. AR TaxID=1165841 RepID=UPI00025C4E82|nr:radical SAM/SPASM domain-containing protein [Sulfurovum sp. AR]EIF51482.1 molybdenum cofactor biosynthesis protein [Sulfurovum sp. AR]
MNFYRIYIELTNVCGLSCSFCPTKALPTKEMDLDFFESILKQAKVYTKEIACHVVGDPLTLSNLDAYLDIIHKHGLKAMLTTSGYFLKKHSYDTLFHPCVKQINISLNSFNKNDTSITFEQYMNPVLALCEAKLERGEDIFINLRVWNLDEMMSERRFNETLFEKLSSAFGTKLDLKTIYEEKPKSLRLASKILVHFDNYFEWPSLNNRNYGHGTCQGLQSHVAILASGKVVPCCLDCDGIIELGDLHENTLDEILTAKRAVDMVEGFKEGKAVEELCQKCSYKDRFND